MAVLALAGSMNGNMQLIAHAWPKRHNRWMRDLIRWTISSERQRRARHPATRRFVRVMDATDKMD